MDKAEVHTGQPPPGGLEMLWYSDLCTCMYDSISSKGDF